MPYKPKTSAQKQAKAKKRAEAKRQRKQEAQLRAEEILTGKAPARKLSPEQEDRAARIAAGMFFRKYDIDTYKEHAKTLSRRFVLHCGPTNSGKTFHALKALKRAETGAYLGPLRLLALEVFDTLNEDGVPCDLLTGEEHISVEGAQITASTIEVFDSRKRYDVVVIDEAQLLADPLRGSNWTTAILEADAQEVHICFAPSAKRFIVSLLEQIGAEYTLNQYERLTPLQFDGTFSSLDDIQPGDAIIAFSRKTVLEIAAKLERQGVKASVIYGALPPESRREEVRKFSSGETSVAVATDAIGLGVSLPIQRIIFFDVSKFDGLERRLLTESEVKQIAGRAGRFGKYPIGYVLAMRGEQHIRKMLMMPDKEITKAFIPFPARAIDLNDIPLKTLYQVWDSASDESSQYIRERMSTAMALLQYLEAAFPKMSKRQVFVCSTCPLDIKQPAVVSYWLQCCGAWYKGKPFPFPFIDDSSLEGCEIAYRQLDVLSQMCLRREEHMPKISRLKAQLCKQINDYLKSSKNQYIRCCHRCKKELPITYPYGLCEECYRKTYVSWNSFG